LDLFILKLVQDGVRTPYDWQAKAGISLGASLPAVRRVLSQGHLKEEERGPRGRRTFSLTRSGKDIVRKIGDHLEERIEQAGSDLETVLRLLCIAVSARKYTLATNLLRRAAGSYEGHAQDAHARVGVPTTGDPAHVLYTAAMAYCDSLNQKATAGSLISLMSFWRLDSERPLPSRLPAKKGHYGVPKGRTRVSK
jgi:hypothetical protein